MPGVRLGPPAASHRLVGPIPIARRRKKTVGGEGCSGTLPFSNGRNRAEHSSELHSAQSVKLVWLLWLSGYIPAANSRNLRLTALHGH